MSSPPQLRPVNGNELDALHTLITTIERAADQPYLTARGEVDELFEDEINPAHENLRVLDDDGILVGWAHVLHSPSGQKLERAILHGGVHPDRKRQGLGQQILTWQNDHASARLAQTSPELEAIIIAEGYSWQEDKNLLFSSGGFEAARFFDELQRPLANDVPAPTEPDGISVVPWADEHFEPSRLVYNEAFLDHWGTTPRSEAAWRSDVIESYARRLDLSFVAYDGEEMVGYCLNAHYPDDEAVTGRRDGWVDSICTLSSHRGKGIASALVVYSLNAFAEAGFNSSMLGVDSDNPTGAYGIYERLGYRQLQREVAYVKTIREGTSPVQMF